ncbi:MAG: CHAP domain-containing protein [Spirochaetales bacterium]|nr:CHAP domain-containing protein [Spirochaetales bacterium]
MKNPRLAVSGSMLLLLLLLTACASYGGGPLEGGFFSEPAPLPQEGTSVQRQLIECANAIRGSKSLNVRGRSFTFDCTGVVLACYYYAGIDLTLAFPDYTGNGVSRIYNYLKDNRLTYTTQSPEPGDIIFWDNTYDRNADGKENDPLTHMGMVVHTDGEGQISYIHANYRKGIVFEQMNLTRPDVYMEGTRIINSPMRMKGQKPSPRWLSSHLVKSFGRGYLTEKP